MPVVATVKLDDPLASPRVGSNPKSGLRGLPMPCMKVVPAVKGVRLPLGHGYTKHRSWTREESGACRAQTCERRIRSEWFGSSTDAGVCVGFGGFGCDSAGTENFGSGWVSVLGDFLDGWSETPERVTRHSVDDQVVFKLRQDRRAGTLVGVGRGASLVHKSEWSDRDSSGSQADRSDGRSEHSVDEFAWLHTERQSQVGSGRDSGCQ